MTTVFAENYALCFILLCDKLLIKGGYYPVLKLFVLDASSGEKVPVTVDTATEQDLAATQDWQTNWTTPYALSLPNKVALHRTDDGELLGLMSYELDEKGLAVEIISFERARPSTVNLLSAEWGHKKNNGIAKGFFVYATPMSFDNHFYGVLYFRSYTSEIG